MAASEIGIEWVDDYHSWMWPDLMNCQEEAERFQNRLNGISSFNWGDDLAWDQDFEEQGASTWHPTGDDTMYADAVDIVFYAGHGESSGPKFGVSSHDSGKVKHSELRLGNGDSEWAVFDACYVLKEGGKYYNHCYDMFKGLHYIFGFHTVVGDSPTRGEIFADYLNAGETVRNAWIKASQDSEPSSTEWAYLRAGSSGTTTYSEQWFSAGAVSSDPDPNTQTIYYLRGTC
jgi:hypothetical protein